MAAGLLTAAGGQDLLAERRRLDAAEPANLGPAPPQHDDLVGGRVVVGEHGSRLCMGARIAVQEVGQLLLLAGVIDRRRSLAHGVMDELVEQVGALLGRQVLQRSLVAVVVRDLDGAGVVAPQPHGWLRANRASTVK